MEEFNLEDIPVDFDGKVGESFATSERNVLQEDYWVNRFGEEILRILKENNITYHEEYFRRNSLLGG